MLSACDRSTNARTFLLRPNTTASAASPPIAWTMSLRESRHARSNDPMNARRSSKATGTTGPSTPSQATAASWNQPARNAAGRKTSDPAARAVSQARRSARVPVTIVHARAYAAVISGVAIASTIATLSAS